MSEVPIDQIKPSPYQVRLRFKTEDLKEEIQRDGLLSHLIVRRRNGYYELVDGQRRLEALKELGWKKVPVEIQEVDDRKARLMVYKINSIRESYTTEEEARYFKKLADEGMKPYEIEMELGVKHSWVQACLNVWKLPEDIQNNIFAPRGKTAYQVYMSDVRDLEGVINRNLDEATTTLREIINKRMTVDEKQRLVTDRAKKIDEARLKAVEQALPKIEPEVSKLETPEELEKVAVTLQKEAKRRREEVLTPEEKARIETEKKHKAEEKRKRQEESKKYEEERLQKKLEVEKRRLENEAKRNLEEERRRLEEEAKKRFETEREHIKEQATEKLMQDRGHLEEAEKRLKKMRFEELRTEKKGEEQIVRRIQPNLLNDLAGDEWLKFTKSWYTFDALESDLAEERETTSGLTEEHPATFSPTMISDYIRFFTKRDAVILDPFLGIGSTLVACSRTGRKGIGIDVNEQYVEIARKRVGGDPNQKVIHDDAWNIDKHNLPKIDYCVTSPPYFRMLEKIDVTQRRRIKEGLATDYGDSVALPEEVNEYVNALVGLFSKIARMTKENGYLTVIMQNFRDRGRMVPLAWQFAIAMQEKRDWIFKGERIWLQNHKILHPFGQKFDFVPNIHHHYCLIFKRA